MLIFDIETGGLPPEQIAAIVGDFDPESVKYGNLKDEVKKAEKLKEARAEWEESCVNQAALSAATGEVLAIGYYSPEKKKTTLDHGKSEADLLVAFWKQYQKMRSANRKLIGVNILNFDVPFMVRRSWICGVDVPATVRNGRYLDGLFLDLRELWLCGQRFTDCQSSLDHMARALGVGHKNGNGADFAKLYRGTAVEKQAALDYLTNDLNLTALVAQKMGLI